MAVIVESCRQIVEGTSSSFALTSPTIRSGNNQINGDGQDTARALAEGSPLVGTPGNVIAAGRNVNTRPPVTILPAPARLTQLIPPANYGAVESGFIFRSAYPAPENYNFIKKLHVKTIVTLVKDIPKEYSDFCTANQIRHVQIHVPANKDGNIKVTQETVEEVHKVVLNRELHPMLIHCNRGKHRTGCIIACLRKVQSCSTAFALEEYNDYAFPKARPDDVRFIESFDPSPVREMAEKSGFCTTTPLESMTDLDRLMADAEQSIAREFGTNSNGELDGTDAITPNYTTTSIDTDIDMDRNLGNESAIATESDAHMTG